MRARIVIALALQASCNFGRPKPMVAPEVTRFVLDASTLTVETHRISFRERERDRDLRIDLRSGECTVLPKRPAYPPLSRAATTPLGDRPVALAPGTTARRIESRGELYLEITTPAGPRNVLLPSATQIAVVVGTPLLLLDGTTLFSYETDRRVTVDRHGGIPFAIVDRRVYVVERHQLVAYDFQLAAVERLAPRLTLYRYEGTGDPAYHRLLDRPPRDPARLRPAPWEAPASLGDEWREIAPDLFARQQGMRLVVEHRYPQLTQQVADVEVRGGEARWHPGTSIIVTDHFLWDARSRRKLERPPGPLVVSVGLRQQFVKTEAGTIFNVSHAWLAPEPPTIGHLLHADERGFVLAHATDVWLATRSGVWRRYSAACDASPDA